MLSRENSVVFLAAWIDACALYRMYMPHLNIPQSSFFCFLAGPDFTTVAGFDACVVQRCCTQPQFDFIRTTAALGIKIIYDMDDDVWDLPDYNPAHDVLNRCRDGFGVCIRMVDVVTVSTRTLAKAVRKNVELKNQRTGKAIPIVVVENRIDRRLFVPPAPPPADKVRVGFAGSSSHIGDLAMIQEIVRSVADEPTVEFEFRGCELPAGFPQSSNITHKHWMPVAEYGGRMPLWGWSMAMAPLVEHPFNDSKSSLKFCEAGLCSIPCLGSWVRPYDEFCSHDPELRFLLCAGVSSWEKKLRTLIRDPAMRQEYGQRMRKVVDTYYTFDQPHEGWRSALQTALNV